MSPSISGHGNLRYRYYRCRSRAGGISRCRGVCISAGEIEEYLRDKLGNAESDAAGTNENGIRLSLAWQQQLVSTQFRLLSAVLREVVFDPDGGTIEIEVATDAARLLK
jgi:hypothetical protein